MIFSITAQDQYQSAQRQDFLSLITSKQVDGKRLRIEIAILKEMIQRKEIAKVSWVPTAQQISNCLTKGGANAQSLLETISC